MRWPLITFFQCRNILPENKSRCSATYGRLISVLLSTKSAIMVKVLTNIILCVFTESLEQE